jgi:hypothetical protein
MNGTTQQISDKLYGYGMMVSSHHDFRYYDAEFVRNAQATPNTCPEEIKQELILLYGEDRWWQEFWGGSYYTQHPEQMND